MAAIFIRALHTESVSAWLCWTYFIYLTVLAKQRT